MCIHSGRICELRADYLLGFQLAMADNDAPPAVLYEDLAALEQDFDDADTEIRM